MNIVLKKDGTIQFIYDEKLIGALSGVSAERVDKRATYVEPDPDNPGKWYVDLSPSGGPVVKDFSCRSAAIKYELDWLKENILSGGKDVRN